MNVFLYILLCFAATFIGGYMLAAIVEAQNVKDRIIFGLINMVTTGTFLFLMLIFFTLFGVRT